MVLLDIEGTVAPIAFVHEILFPYARSRLADFIRKNWSCPGLAEAREQVARDDGAAIFAEWDRAPGTAKHEPQDRLTQQLLAWMDRDSKATGLKLIQGMIWKAGYEAGELRSALYPDVPVAMHAWAEAGVDVRIYSSGSTAAQQLFFRYTEHGDLTPLLRGYFDTTVGPKTADASYARIAGAAGYRPDEILFISDVVRELDAARSAGLQTRLALRPGNPPLTDRGGHSALHSLDTLTQRHGPE